MEITNTAITQLSQLSQYLWERPTGTEGNSLVADPKMIALSDALGGVLHDSNIEIPQIVVVGTQSSGKSSVLNSLIGMDILPTGKQMVTRTPLHLEIVRSGKGKTGPTRAEFGDYSSGAWTQSSSYPLTFPTPTDSEQIQLCDYIEAETRRLAGEQCDISDSPIHLRITSPHVTNLSFVDLPGLTAVACRDRGQPADIKVRLERLVASFIEKPSTLILAVLPGRSDLEADMGLEVVKKYDPEGLRTVGVLTKLDLMNDPADVVPYLEGRVSRDLQLKHGYFAVRNRCSTERGQMSVVEGLQLEARYFSDTTTFPKRIAKQLGCPTLKGYLAGLLTHAIKTHLPSLLTEVQQNLSGVEAKLAGLGEAIPDEVGAQSNFIHTIVTDFCRDFTQCVAERGSSASTGRDIRDSLVKCRREIGEANAFHDQSTITDTTLDSIVQSAEGNHMSFPYPPVEILERCMQDKERRPLMQLATPLKACNAEITGILTDLVQGLLEKGPVSRFPDLVSKIRNEAVQSVILEHSKRSVDALLEAIHIQEDYIWSDDAEFRHTLLAFGKEDYSSNLVPALRTLLGEYVRSVSGHIADVAPKSVMYHLVNASTRQMYSRLYQETVDVKLLVEDPEVEQRRKDWGQTRDDLVAALATIRNIAGGCDPPRRC